MRSAATITSVICGQELSARGIGHLVGQAEAELLLI